MSELPMRGHFRYLSFKTFPMTPRTPQCKVFCPLLLSSKHSGVPEDSQPPTFPSVGLHPHTWPKWGCDNTTIIMCLLSQPQNMYVFWSLFSPCSFPTYKYNVNPYLISVYDKWSRDIVCFYKVCHPMCHFCPLIFPIQWQFCCTCNSCCKGPTQLGFHELFWLVQWNFDKPFNNLGALNSRKPRITS